jgi:hypothetical protein
MMDTYEMQYSRVPTPGEQLKTDIELRKSISSRGFGCSTDRFHNRELTLVPGVGQYSNMDSSLVLKSPSFSNKGYGISGSPKKSSFLVDLGEFRSSPSSWTMPLTSLPSPCYVWLVSYL